MALSLPTLEVWFQRSTMTLLSLSRVGSVKVKTCCPVLWWSFLAYCRHPNTCWMKTNALEWLFTVTPVSWYQKILQPVLGMSTFRFSVTFPPLFIHFFLSLLLFLLSDWLLWLYLTLSMIRAHRSRLTPRGNWLSNRCSQAPGPLLQSGTPPRP